MNTDAYTTSAVYAPPETKLNRYPLMALAGLGLAVIIHRVIQLYLIWPLLAHQIELNAHVQIMQLLPRELWRNNFEAAIVYLQQAPPLPNLLYGFASVVLQSPQNIAICLIILNALMAMLTAILMALLMIRLGINHWAALALTALFIFSPDLVLIEYQTWGHFFYESATILLALLATHAAISLVRSQSGKYAVWLGVWVALMALTRATYSYLFIVVALWLVWVMWPTNARRLLVVALFLLPVAILQGGWSTKNLLVHGYWSIATSSWGGANAYTGDAMRHGGASPFKQWIRENPSSCGQPWDRMIGQLPPFILLVSLFDPARHYQLPEAIVKHDDHVTSLRGQRVTIDTLAFRELSNCLQSSYPRYWLSDPKQVLLNTVKSYQLFWMPVRQFNLRHPNPIMPDISPFQPSLNPLQSLKAAKNSLGGERYRIVQRSLSFEPVRDTDLKRVTMLTVPTWPLVMHAFNLFSIHGLAAVAGALFFFSGRHIEGLRRSGLRLSGFSFLILLYLYLAGLSSLIEYGENMRFRLELEPIIWTLSTVCLVITWRWLRPAKNQQPKD